MLTSSWNSIRFSTLSKFSWCLEAIQDSHSSKKTRLLVRLCKNLLCGLRLALTSLILCCRYFKVYHQCSLKLGVKLQIYKCRNEILLRRKDFREFSSISTSIFYLFPLEAQSLSRIAWSSPRNNTSDTEWVNPAADF